MNLDISLGICVDNLDPFNYGRIRVVDYETYKAYSNAKEILSYLTGDNNGKYDEWLSKPSSTKKQPDPYLCESFLPNNLSTTPKPGQLVRLLKETNGKTFFIGPITSNPIYMTGTYKEYQYNNKTYVSDEIANNPNNTVMSSDSGEQIVLGGDTVLVRLSHVDTNNGLKKQYPLFQISKFTKNIKYKETTVTTAVENEIFLDYVLQLTFEYVKKTSQSDKNIKCTVALYDTQETIIDDKNKKGLTRKLYRTNKEYFDGQHANQYTVRHILEFNDVSGLDSAIESIISSYVNKKIKFFNPELVGTQAIKTQNSNINLLNRIQLKPNAGGANNEVTDSVPNLINFVVRIKPNSKDVYTKPTLQLQQDLGIPKSQPADTTSLDSIRFNEFNAFIRMIKKYSSERWLGDQNLQPKFTETKKTVEPTVDERSTSVNVQYSDKFLFLSSLNSPEYLSDVNEGMSLETVYKFLSSIDTDGKRDYKTYGFVRGEKIMSLLNEILDVFLSHGHSIGQVQNSLSKEAEEKISKLKGQIAEEIQGNNLNKTNGVINHNLRLN